MQMSHTTIITEINLLPVGRTQGSTLLAAAPELGWY